MPIVGCGSGRYRKPKESVRSVEERDKLVAENIALAISRSNAAWLSQEWIRQRMSKSDLAQEAKWALIRAAELWDPEDPDKFVDGRPVKFVTYACRSIDNVLYRRAQQSGLIRIAAHRKVREWSEIPTASVRELPCDENGNYLEPADPNGECFDEIDMVRNAVMTLPRLERDFVCLYYGILGNEQLSMSKIAALHGFSKGYVQEVLGRANNRLGRRLAEVMRKENGDKMPQLRIGLGGQKLFACCEE